jgi:FkbM family methyltransferase
VIAIEPNPQACKVLRKNVELNGLHDRVEIVPMAVGEMAGHATLYASGTDGMSRIGSPYPHLVATARPVTVPVVRLDDLCRARGLKPDWIVLDVEGYEIHALAGAGEVITTQAPRLGLVVEMHPTVWSAHGVSRARAESLLERLGLRAISMSGQQDPLGEQGLVLLQYGDIHR